MINFIKRIIRKVHWIFSTQFGFDFRLLLRTFRGFHLYIRDWLIFRGAYHGKLNFMPCINDRFEEGGAIRTEYFWQDLFVARRIYTVNPVNHVDVGSRVDGFVAHVASYRTCEVIDIRPITTSIPGVIFRQADVMDPSTLIDDDQTGYCDSLSCLHAIEHFGLGRYGDPINPFGYQDGIRNMARLLKVGGTFYLSTPVGDERVEFNANWVFDPRTILNCANDSGLALTGLYVISPRTGVEESKFDAESLAALSKQKYKLCLFIFTKK